MARLWRPSWRLDNRTLVVRQRERRVTVETMSRPSPDVIDCVKGGVAAIVINSTPRNEPLRHEGPAVHSN